MSTYEDYATTSADYDATRVPVGAEVIIGAVATAGVPLADVHLLDAGCGTGNYAAALAPHVGALTLADASAGMLAKAKAKLAGAGTGAGTPPVDVHEAVLPHLPFEDDTFHAVMINQVLHHVGDLDGETWENHHAAIAELGRVLRPGGVLVVNTTAQEQLRNGYWYFSLIPGAAEALRKRYAPLDELEGAMTAAGLKPSGRFVPLGQPIQAASYYDGRNALDEGWRNGDSTWALASREELAAAIDKARALDAEGGLDAYVAEHDGVADVGQVTFVVARHR